MRLVRRLAEGGLASAVWPPVVGVGVEPTSHRTTHGKVPPSSDGPSEHHSILRNPASPAKPGRLKCGKAFWNQATVVTDNASGALGALPRQRMEVRPWPS